MVSRADAERLRLAQVGIRTLVERDLEAFWGSLNLGRPKVARDALLEFVPLLVSQYGESAASMAADWYDDLRASEGVRGSFRSEAFAPDETAAMTATVRRTADALFTDAPEGMLTAVTAKAGKYVLNASRMTVARSTHRDPAAAGWQRITRPDACKFCVMLHGRGAVYKRETVFFASHGGCNCAAAPSWDQSAPEVDVDLYEASRRTTMMTPAQRERHNALIRRAIDEYT